MQLSKLAILSLLSSVAQAAPVVVTVTNVVVVTTVIVAGQTQAVNNAAVTFSAPTGTTSSVETTPTTTPVIQAAAVVESSTSSTEEYTPTTLTTVATTPTTSSTTTPTPTPTTTSTEAPTTTSTSSEAATTTSASSTDSDFASQILAEHNAKRALHGVDSLSWDDTLASYAQNYADQYDCSGSLKHSGGEYGENLALGYTTTGSVDAWYSEGDNYDYGSGCSVYDHFTQVIWKSTTKVGCGYKYCNSYWGTYIVCSYDPAGNYVGECDSEVLPLA